MDARAATSGEPAGPGVARFFRLDGLQRANSLLLVFLLAAGFGVSSGSLLDDGTIETARLAASVLCVAHVAICGYAAFFAATSGEAAVPWLLKCGLTGAGGLAELRREVAAREPVK